MSKIGRRFGLWQARRRGKRNAKRDWDNRFYNSSELATVGRELSADELQAHVKDSLSWLDYLDRGERIDYGNGVR